LSFRDQPKPDLTDLVVLLEMEQNEHLTLERLPSHFAVFFLNEVWRSKMKKLYVVVCASSLLVACSGENISNDVNNKQGKWWEKTDKYAICYGNVTAAHKANGLHERNRSKSIQIKEEICKIAATSKTGEASHWLK